jgi:hypothetical protein
MYVHTVMLPLIPVTPLFYVYINWMANVFANNLAQKHRKMLDPTDPHGPTQNTKYSA